MIAPNSLLAKTDLGQNIINHPTLSQRKALDSRLRQLLILIDGHRTVAELSTTMTGIDNDAFETLIAMGLVDYEDDYQQLDDIAFVQSTLSFNAHADLSSVRFKVLDIMLDLSMQDFSIRPWIDAFEQANNVEAVANLVQDFCVSEEGRKHAITFADLKAALQG